jgi:hypothetical protein
LFLSAQVHCADVLCLTVDPAEVLSTSNVGTGQNGAQPLALHVGADALPLIAVRRRRV